MRVCFFGAWDPAYPRNRILRAGLERHGVAVAEARVPARRAFRRWPALALAFARAGQDCDVVLVPEFRHKDVPLARRLAGSRRVVFDPLVSRWDTLVGDWAIHAPRSAQARWNRWIDRRALRAADVVLCDTWEHGRLFESLGAPAERLRRVLVGAEDPFFAIAPRREGGRAEVLYVGGFLPLHGTLTIVEAAGLLERRAAALPEYRIRLAGSGIEVDAARARAAELGLDRLEFPGPIEYARLPEAIAGADLVLGAFGSGPKAGRVIPHKVYQGLAAGRAVVSGDGPGVREVFAAGEHLELVPRGDAGALAETLARLLCDRVARERLGRRARARALEVATPERIGASLIEAIGAAA